MASSGSRIGQAGRWPTASKPGLRNLADESRRLALDAERVERFGRRLPLANRQVVLAFYIARESPVVSHRRFGLSRQRFYALLDEAAAWCHDEGLQFDRS